MNLSFSMNLEGMTDAEAVQKIRDIADSLETNGVMLCNDCMTHNGEEVGYVRVSD